MSGIGVNIGESGNTLVEKRIRKGECPTCGNRTHKVNFMGRKTPLNVEGLCRNGQCLKCHPIEGYIRPTGGSSRPLEPPPSPAPAPSPERPASRRDIPAPGPALADPYDRDPRQHHQRDAPAAQSAPGYDLHVPAVPYQQQQRDVRVHPQGHASGYDLHVPAYEPRPAYDPRLDRFPPRVAPQQRPPTGVSGLPFTTIEVPEFNDDATQITMDYELIEGARRWQRQQHMMHHEKAIQEDESDPGDMDLDMIPPTRLRPQKPEPSLYPDTARPSQRPRPISRPDAAYAVMDTTARMDRLMEDVTPSSRRISSSSRSRRDLGVTERLSPVPSQKRLITQPSSKRKSEIDARELHNLGLPDAPSIGDSGEEEKHEVEALDSERYIEPSGGYGQSPPREQFFNTHPGSFRYGMQGAHHISDLSEDDHKEPNGAIPNPPDLVFTPTGYMDRPGIKAMGQSFPAPQMDDPPLVRNRGRPDEDHAEAPSRLHPGRPTSNRPAHVAAAPPAQESWGTSGKKLSQPGATEMPPSPMEKNPTVHDIPNIVYCLNNIDTTNNRLRERAFQSLTEIVWKHGSKAKAFIDQYRGLEALVKNMWEDMGNPAVQAAATELLFALSASLDGDSQSDILVGDNAASAVDALLIVMQTHLSIESIQRSGCGALNCLAAASGFNLKVTDGALSGAVLCVVNAMDAHRNSRNLQEWGLRALHSQCLLSVNAESNKSNLANFENSGVHVISRAMQLTQSDLVAAEQACRLLWCLSSSGDFASKLSSAPHVHTIVEAARCHEGKPEASPLFEASFGTLVNLTKDSSTHALCHETGVLTVIAQSMTFFIDPESEGVNTEACALLANLATSPVVKDGILHERGIECILEAMRTFPTSEELQSEGFRALLTLAIGDETVKDQLASEGPLSHIMEALASNEEAAKVQYNGFCLLCSLSADKSAASNLVLHGAIPASITALKLHEKERRLVETIAGTWRNLACHGEGVSDFLRQDALTSLVRVMQTNIESESMQVNACSTFWNLCSRADDNDVRTRIVDSGAIGAMIKSMQAHPESQALLNASCGAIWTIASDSNDVQESIMNHGGVEAVVCAMMMHPQETRILEMALGVLSNVSGIEAIAKAIGEAQGVSIVVETMRSNSSKVRILELGSLILRNVVLFNPVMGPEVAGGISTIITAMKENREATEFQKEACTALWAMAAQSEVCRSKINALDGSAVLMDTIDHEGATEELQEVAKSAFSQLAVPAEERPIDRLTV